VKIQKLEANDRGGIHGLHVRKCKRSLRPGCFTAELFPLEGKISVTNWRETSGLKRKIGEKQLGDFAKIGSGEGGEKGGDLMEGRLRGKKSGFNLAEGENGTAQVRSG